MTLPTMVIHGTHGHSYSHITVTSQSYHSRDRMNDRHVAVIQSRTLQKLEKRAEGRHILFTTVGLAKRP